MPSRQSIESNGVRYVIGDDALEATRDAARVWTVTRDRYTAVPRIDPAFAPSPSVAPRTFSDELTVRLYEKRR